MIDIFSLISKNTRAFEDFRKWLFVELKNNKQTFTNYGKYPTSLKLPLLIKYLESKDIPIVESIVYHDLVSSNNASSFEQLLAFTVKCEFEALEKNETINYIPF